VYPALEIHELYVSWQKKCKSAESTVDRMEVLFGGVQAAVARFQQRQTGHMCCPLHTGIESASITWRFAPPVETRALMRLLTNDKPMCKAEQHDVLESCNINISDISYRFFPSLKS
jgi:hypothetical protein